MSQSQTSFDVHDPQVVLNKLAQIRMALRQMDDDITGIIYLAVAQVQKEQKEAAAAAKPVETEPPVAAGA